MGTSQTKAKNKYNKTNYDTILLSMPKGNKSKLQAVAATKKISVNKLLNSFIDELLAANTDIRIEQTKVDDALKREAQEMNKNLNKFRTTAEAKPESHYVTRRKGYIPQPTDALIEIWTEKLEKGFSYAQLEEMQLHTTHKFTARTIGAKVEQLKLLKAMSPLK